VSTLVSSPTGQRRLGFGLVGVGVVLALIAFNATSEPKPAKRTLGLGAAVRALDLELVSARVDVLPATGDPSITIRGSDEIRVTDAATVQVRCKRPGGCGTPRITVRLPQNAAVRAAIERGAVTVDKLRARSIDLRSTTGDVNAFSVRSPTVRLESTSGEIHASLAAIADSLTTRSTTGGTYLTVPYDYTNDGYNYVARSSGQVDLDMTLRKSPEAKRISAVSRSGNIGLAQRYPNMS
jgi:hypothetical protein